MFYFHLPANQISAAQAAANQAPDFLDDLIAISIVFFILSVIVEKITNLIRHYAPFKLGKMVNGKVALWQNIGKKSPKTDVPLKKLIEREVMSLSFIVGLTIAVAFRVDLFKMISAPNARDVLFWSQTKWADYDGFFDLSLLLISLALSGFFLTFGSKFFHDLLDVLFAAKNAKRKLVDPNTYQQDDIKSFDEYFKASYSSIIDAAIAQNQQLFNNADVVGGPMHGQLLKNGHWVDCVDVHLKTNNSAAIPAQVTAKLDSGQSVTVPVKVVAGLGDAVALSNQGSSVDATRTPAYQGTICCRVQDNSGNQFLLTCSHVMTGGSSTNSFGEITPPVAAEVGGFPNFQFTWAKCDINYDMALLAPGDGSFSYVISPGKPRALTAKDLSKTITIVPQGGVKKTGKVVNYCSKDLIPIKYTDRFSGMANLIVLANVITNDDQIDYQTLSAPGDSGACVYDEANNPVGMIIAGDQKFSYAISLTQILTELKATLVT
jgi:hypothetical protein